MSAPRIAVNREEMEDYRKALKKIIANGVTKAQLEQLGGGTIKKSDIDNFVNRKSGTAWSTPPTVAIANLIDQHFKDVLADARKGGRIPVLEEIERAALAPEIYSPVDLQGLYTGVQKDRYGYRVLMLEVRKVGDIVYYQTVRAAGRAASADNTECRVERGVLFLTGGEIGLIGEEEKRRIDFTVFQVPDSSMGKVSLWSAAARTSRGGKSLIIAGTRYSNIDGLVSFFVEQHSQFRGDKRVWVLGRAIADDRGVYGEGSLREELSIGIARKTFGFDDVAGVWEMHSWMDFDASEARKHFEEGIEKDQPMKPVKSKAGAKKRKK
jgi:hypothetical protein